MIVIITLIMGGLFALLGILSFLMFRKKYAENDDNYSIWSHSVWDSVREAEVQF